MQRINPNLVLVRIQNDKNGLGTGSSPAGHWTRLLTFTVWAQVQFLVKELRSHRPYRVAKKKKILIQLEDTRTKIGCELLLRIMGNTGRCDSGEEEDVLILRGCLLND